MTSAPAATSWRTVSPPMPPLAPVTRTVRPLKSVMGSAHSPSSRSPRSMGRGVPRVSRILSVVVLSRQDAVPLGASHDLPHVLHASAVGLDLGRALLGERQTELGPDLLRHLLARRIQDRQLLLRQMVVHPAGELLDRVVECLGVGAPQL